MGLVVDAQINAPAALLIKADGTLLVIVGVSEAGRGLFLQRTGLMWKALWSKGTMSRRCWAWHCYVNVQREGIHLAGTLRSPVPLVGWGCCWERQACECWDWAAWVPGGVILRSSAFPLGTVTSGEGGAHSKWGIEHKCTFELFLARDNAAADIAVGSKCWDRVTQFPKSLLNVFPYARPQRPKSVVEPDAV